MEHLSRSAFKCIVGKDNNIDMYKYNEFLDEYYKFSIEIFNANLLTFPVIENKTEIYFLYKGTMPFCEKIIDFIKTIMKNKIDNPFCRGIYEMDNIVKLISFICRNMFKIYENYCPKSYYYPERQVEYDTITRIKIFSILN